MQMQFQSRKTDLATFQERAEALERAIAVLEEGITNSRAQVSLCWCSKFGLGQLRVLCKVLLKAGIMCSFDQSDYIEC